jgi:carbamoyltransferase
VDGFGDFASAAWGLGRGHAIPIDGRVYFPHSLGIFYSAITQWLGFPHFGDEYKVMGLAPYGESKYLELMREIVRVQRDGTYELNLRFFHHHTSNVSYSWKDCAPEVGTLYTPALEELLGPARAQTQPLEQRHRDMARSAQAMYEEAFFALLKTLHAKYQCPNLALSGGCVMNSVANGKVYLESPFKKMYLPAAAGDAGGAIGAAFVVAAEEKAESRKQKAEIGPERKAQRADRKEQTAMPHAYTGPQFEDAEIEKLLQSRGLLSESPVAPSSGSGFLLSAFPISALSDPPAAPSSVQNSKFDVQDSKLDPSTPLSALASAARTFRDFSVSFLEPAELCRRTATAITEGKVVGWFQGRMEWGPRALGNRSILGDPRRADMKDILNARIKRRESFRPFAPSILREHVAEWFEQDDDVPFMMEVFKFRAEKRALVPAVCHVDGSGRLQTVHRDTNPLYHQLISEFCALTSVPMVLNTSFNENEPVVCRPEEALDCFLRTKMDVLVLEKFFVERTL